MDLPAARKRLSAFIAGEEGKISRQSLLAMGAFLASGAAASMVAAEDGATGPAGPTDNPEPTTPITTPSSTSSDSTIQCTAEDRVPIPAVDHTETGAEEANCDPKGPDEPGQGCPVDENALTGHNAYFPGTNDPKYFGNMKCSDDKTWFHFNSAGVGYEENLAYIAHSHHASHNSY